jgi:DNA-binding transcriptional LysR family regulator
VERINFKLLVALSVMIEQKNITRAAEKLNISQSALSRQLSHLREYFKDELLVREGHDYCLTDLALELKPKIEAILDQVDGLKNTEVFDPATCTKAFTFSSTDYVAGFIFPDVITQLSSQAPHINLTFKQWQSDWISQLGTMSIDFVTTMISEVPENLYGIKLGCDRPVVLMAINHPLNEKDVSCTEDILPYPFIRISAGGDKDGFFDDHLSRLGIKRRIAYEVPFYSAAFKACASTHMLLIVPEHIAINAASHYPLTWRSIDFLDLPKHEYYLLWHSVHHQDKPHKWLRETIASVFKISNFSIR